MMKKAMLALAVLFFGFGLIASQTVKINPEPNQIVFVDYGDDDVPDLLNM